MYELVFPSFEEVIALALNTKLKTSLTELKEMHARQAFKPIVIKYLWPKAKSRKKAFLMGQTTYRGKPCSLHPRSRRYTYCTHCIKCTVARSRKNYLANQEKVINRSREWRENNKEYIKLFNKAKWQVVKTKRNSIYL